MTLQVKPRRQVDTIRENTIR